MSAIKDIKAREVLDSRGNPTLEIDLFLENGVMGRGLVPSGASTGAFEAFELRDKDLARYAGKGVLSAQKNVTQILAPKLTRFESNNQRDFDQLLIEIDASANKSRLGANALLGLSIAYAKASAQNQNQALYQYFAKLSQTQGVTLPVPLMNILNGGAHADNNVDFQEIMIVPFGFDTYSRALQAGVEIFHALKAVLKKSGLSTAVGDEGGFAPNLTSNEQALELVAESVKKSGYVLGQQVGLALDVAASEFYKAGQYVLENEGQSVKSSQQMIDLYGSLITQYPILSIEDGLDQNDWAGWKELTQALGQKVQLVGDDLFVTNSQLLQKGIDQKVGNAVLIKMNQIGTITETLDCIGLAQSKGYRTVISHRSGETEDTTLADLAVGTDAGQIKTGSVSRTDRTAKYNQLLRIEESLGQTAQFLGRKAF